MTQDLRPRMYPHFMEKKNKKKCYTSRKILGQMFDLVERITFQPELLTSFDDRILNAFDGGPGMIVQAKGLKLEYDNHMRRILAQHAINTEFEVWSTFVMQHNHNSDYKMQEDMAQISGALKDQFRKRAIVIAGGNDYEQLAPFVAAMYRVTADEFNNAIEQGRETVHGPETHRMPFISFPWLFQDVLGEIAKLNTSEPDESNQAMVATPVVTSSDGGGRDHDYMADKTMFYAGSQDFEDNLETRKGVTHRGDLLELDFDMPKPITDSNVQRSVAEDADGKLSSHSEQDVIDAFLVSSGNMSNSRSIDNERNDLAGATRNGDEDEIHDDASDAGTIEDFSPPPNTASIRAKLAALGVS